jgi:hypothetical protein
MIIRAIDCDPASSVAIVRNARPIISEITLDANRRKSPEAMELKSARYLLLITAIVLVGTLSQDS